MAEIRSTMDMVMERAARMGGDSGSDLEAEEKVKDGMRAGAGYLRGEVADLAQVVSSQAESDRLHIVKGIVQALLRNIALPRESDQQQASEAAMNGLIQVGQGSHAIVIHPLADSAYHGICFYGIFAARNRNRGHSFAPLFGDQFRPQAFHPGEPAVLAGNINRNS